MKLTPREPTPEMVEAERVKFEAWCDAEGIDASYWLRCDKRTGYENGRTADYWTGWKSRAMHDAAPKVEAKPVCRDDGRCQYAIDSGAEGLGHCPKGKCVMPLYTHLAAPTAEAEPVAWTALSPSGKICHFDGAPMFMVGPVGNEHHTTPLYTHPAAPQPAALPDLSDAEIGRLVDRMDNTHDSDLLKFARAVIAAMKGKQ